jgi:hypothetical protein
VSNLELVAVLLKVKKQSWERVLKGKNKKFFDLSFFNFAFLLSAVTVLLVESVEVRTQKGVENKKRKNILGCHFSTPLPRFDSLGALADLRSDGVTTIDGKQTRVWWHVILKEEDA